MSKYNKHFDQLDKAEYILKQIRTMERRIEVNQEYIHNPIGFTELQEQAAAQMETRKAVVKRLWNRYIAHLDNYLTELKTEQQ